MIQFDGWRVPDDFISDGCTLARDGRRNRYRPACVLHDFLRRHAIVPASDADEILRRHMLALGASRVLAWVYWLGARVTAKIFPRTQPLPLRWVSFQKRVV